MTRAEVDEKMEEIIEFSEVREFIDTPVKRYSSGMYVKLAFSVAAHLDSDIMIMDEVLAVGDVAFQKKCLSRMSAAATTEGRTILYVSHNMSTVRQICTRCIVMKEGKIIFDGDVEEAIRIYSEESFKFELRQDLDVPETFPVNQCGCVTSFEILDRDNLIFDATEKLKVRFGVKIVKPCENVACLISVRYAGVNLVGSYMTEYMHFNEVTDNGYFDVELDLSNLAQGKYFCELRWGEPNSGRFVLHEERLKLFGFEISENKRRNDFNWDIGRWGYNMLTVESLKYNKGN